MEGYSLTQRYTDLVSLEPKSRETLMARYRQGKVPINKSTTDGCFRAALPFEESLLSSQPIQN